MKFAKELEQDLVPEWRIKYLNYKAGKKYVKAVSRAINRANITPGLRRSGELPPRKTPSFVNGRNPFTPRKPHSSSARNDAEEIDSSPAPIGRGKAPAPKPQTPATAIPIKGERQGLTTYTDNDIHYGSFVPTPPAHPSPPMASDSRNVFQLPAPAIRVPSNTSEPAQRPTDTLKHSLSRLSLQRSTSAAASIPGAPPRPDITRTMSSGGGPRAPQHPIRRLFTYTASPLGRGQSQLDIGMRTLDEVRERERAFFAFLDIELEKVETFYRQKEDHAGQRLAVLREQLHEMRNRRTEEIQEAKRRKEDAAGRSPAPSENGKADGKDRLQGWIEPLKAKMFKPGPNSKALQKMPRTPHLIGTAVDGRRDYIRRPHDHDVPYRTAKRKLKLAIQEFYRGLELLKSYALLNRTAFRKLNKKYDKAVNARPPYRYMTEKVNKSGFVNSDVLDSHIHAVEDLYARYFERGNHKIAAGKLRSLSKRPGDESASAFRNGLLIGIGLVFAIQGLVEGANLLFDDDPTVRQQTSYLMQIYGGYFLMLYLFIMFCLDCRIWTMNKINYPFIFEFDPRSQLDWRQLSEFPSFFLLVFGLFIWLNFARLGSPAMYLYYPCILIGVTFVILFFPAPILWHRSRRWFLYSHGRLLLAGLYPVEFRDFFLGDIYCSLTYATSNIELFFCLNANAWDYPEQCNSSHSRLLGFFAALPPIWRALQCIRRYHDTGNVFPHLVNCGKYTMTIMAAVCLSLYRIQGTYSNLALFITFSSINAIYCSIWDLFMDFSLLQTDSRHRLLRDILALKSKWPYYAIMVVDPILRFAWIFYAIFTHDTQHNTIVSFLTALAEVTRRGMWTLFRVENEHCANVAQYKASRDVPLPYRLRDTFTERCSQEFPGIAEPEFSSPAGKSTGVDVGGDSMAGSARLAPAGTHGSSVHRQATLEEEDTPQETVRRRRADTVGTVGKKSIAAIMAEAHKQDFEKKRKPPEPELRDDVLGDDADVKYSSEEDDDEDSRSLTEERMELRDAEALVERGEEEGN